MNRPADWSPLRGSDPTPGDPVVVGDQARHHADVAAELRAQVSRLRRIGQDDELRGQYADRLREAAEELVGDLQQVERRYARVAAALQRWEPQLRHGQDRADRIHLQARDLDDERRALHRQAGTVGDPELPDDPTPAQQSAFDADQAAAERIRRRLEDIDHELGRLRRELDDVEDGVRGDGRAVAGEIRAAVDDDIEDTTWEDVKGIASDLKDFAVDAWRAIDAAIDKYIPVIKKVVEALQYIGMILAVVALFVPGLNALVIGLTVGLALTQGVLYATGNSSFTELTLAALSLATLGLGAIGGKLVSRAFTRSRAAAAPRAGARAAASARAETQAARAALGRRLGRRLQPAQRAQTRNRLDQLQARTDAEARRRAARAEQGYLDKPLMEVTRGEVFRSAGRENAQLMKDIARMQRQFLDAGIVAAGRGAGTGLHLAQSSALVSSFAEGSNAFAGKSELFPGKPYSQAYEDFKGRWDPLR